MDSVLYVYGLMDTETVQNATELFNNTFITPIGWTFPEWFDTSMEYVAQSVEDFFGISGSQ